MTTIIRGASSAPPATFKPHPERDVVPALSKEERDAVRESMLTLGQQLQPIMVAPDFTILDGHNRWEIARELGWPELAYIVVDVPERLQVDYMVRTAVERRQLAEAGWRDLVAKLKADGWSNRRIAEATGKPKSTVHRVEAAVPSGTPAEMIPVVPDRVTGKDGKSYAAKAPAPGIVRVKGDGFNRKVNPGVAAALATAPEIGLAKAPSLMALAPPGRSFCIVGPRSATLAPWAAKLPSLTAKEIAALEGLHVWLAEYLRLWHELKDAS